MSKLEKILTRADIPTLEKLIGKHAIRLLNVLDPALVQGDTLRDLLGQLHEGAELLVDPSSWNEVVDLLREAEANELLHNCGVMTIKNPWEQLKTISLGGRTPQVTRDAVFSWFQVVLPEVQEPERKMPRANVRPSYGLFPHQLIASNKITEKLKTGEKRVVLHMPTGSGKTRTAMHVICKHLMMAGPSVVLWLAYSEELCEQAASEFEKAWSALGNREVEIGRFWGSYDAPILEISDGFVVAGLGKTYKKAIGDNQFAANLGSNTKLVIIDEAHQAIAPTYALLLDLLHARGPSLLGLTATPGRTWNDLVPDMELADFFARQKVTLEVSGYSNPIDYLIEEGYLARPNFTSLYAAGGTELSEADLIRVRDSLDVPKIVLDKLGEDEQRNLVIIRKVESLVRDHKRVLVFSPSVDNAHLLAAVLEARNNVPARCVSGKTPLYERQRFINWFRSENPEPRVLCNFGVLTTGFDAPQTSAVVIARPTNSLVLYSQMVGRGIRGVRAQGNKEAEIVTVVDQGLWGFGNLVEAFTNWEDAGWDTM
jgi:DNA repair protein RadD